MSQQERGFQSCPFCDGDKAVDEGVQLRLISTSNGYFAVTCYCGAAGPIRSSQEKAIKAWNRRNFSKGDAAHYLLGSSSTLGQMGLRGNLQSFDFSMVLQIVSKGTKAWCLVL